MTSLQRLRFLFSFAWQDLFERNARRTTRVIVVTVAILSGFTLVVYGLALGYEKARLQRLRSDPLALCLWAGNPTLGQKIDPTTLQRLRDRLGQRLDGGRLVGCYPFYETEFDWFVRTPDGELRSTSLRGRTLAPGDPLLPSLPLRSGRPFERPDEEGVIVTDNLLRVLENQAGTPATLRLRSRA